MLNAAVTHFMPAKELARSVRQSFRPKPRMTLSQWADKYARLSAESSADVGQWVTIPYQRGIMDAITDRHIESVTVQKSARVGWTKIINHAVGFHAHYDPCPLMVVQPTIGDAEGYSKDEIAPMIRDSEVLSAIFPPASQRDGGNTILHKPFKNGQLRLVGADSPRGFRRVSMRLVIFDEVDGYAATAGEEGDQLKLGIKRTEFFWNRKILAGSTPTLDSTSRIQRRFKKGDQRYYFVPCPHCDKAQVLKFANMKWPKGQPELAHFICADGCGKEIGYEHQRWMIEEADRRALAGSKEFGWVATNPDAEARHASFHIWAAYSYAPNATWAHIATEWMDSHKNIEERKTFCNTVLGETYKGEGDAPDHVRLFERRESYCIGIVPRGGLILTCGVDVQKDRLECEVVAWGRNGESWSVEYIVIDGDTSQLVGEKSPWPALAGLLNRDYRHTDGADMSIEMMAIDSGYNTNTVYQFVSKHPANRVIAVDGRDKYSMAVGTPKAVEVKVSGKRKARGVKLWPVGVSHLKTELYGWLKQDKPDEAAGEPFPFGYCHFPEYPSEYFKQLTAEEVVPRLVKGFRRYQWEKVYTRNEALDCRVYARAAAFLLGIDKFDAMIQNRWDELETELVPAPATPEPVPAAIPMGRPKVTKFDDPYLNG